MIEPSGDAVMASTFPFALGFHGSGLPVRASKAASRFLVMVCAPLFERIWVKLPAM